MEYYFEERIFILHSLETILSHWQAPSHPFQVKGDYQYDLLSDIFLL